MGNRTRHNSSSDTVTVACKLPHGFEMRLFNMVTKSEAVMGGGYRDVTIGEEDVNAGRITLKGFSHEQNKAPNAQLVGGFALTPGVNRQFWEKWLEQNKKSDIVRNGLIFAHGQHESTVDEAKEKKNEKSNLERLDPKKAPKEIKKWSRRDDDVAEDEAA